jgi:hypothetical protein
MTREATEFNEVLAQYVPQSSDFYRRVRRAYDVLSQVKQQSDGHGITFVMRRDSRESTLDLYLADAHQYNGIPHNLNDPDITEVVAERREKDLATIIDENNNIAGANVPLPMDVVAYKERHGISATMATFLGYDSGEDAPGARTQSALCATGIIGESICIITLGETRPDGRKGPINVYYNGDRIYNSSGRRMRWELAERRPEHSDNVVKFPGSTYGHYCGQRDEQRCAAVVGGPV